MIYLSVSGRLKLWVRDMKVSELKCIEALVLLRVLKVHLCIVFSVLWLVLIMWDEIPLRYILTSFALSRYKICFFGHRYHQKTESEIYVTEFFIDLFELWLYTRTRLTHCRSLNFFSFLHISISERERLHCAVILRETTENVKRVMRNLC